MTWDDYGILIAKTIAKKSKDPNTQVGCYIEDVDHRPISMGYNGLIGGVSELNRWTRPEKYLHVVHAEMNAILFAKRDLSNCSIYITHHPCLECLKNILSVGIRRIIYREDEVKNRMSGDQLRVIDELVKELNVELKKI